MANITEQERGTQVRIKGGNARPRVEFVPIRELGLYVLAKVPPRQEIRADEIAITASSKSRNLQLREQAETVIEKAAKGQHFKDDYIEKLQQRLLSKKDEGSRALAAALGEVRASQVTKDAERMLARAKGGQDVSDQSIQKLQQRTLAVARQKELSSQEFPGLNLVAALGEVRSSRAQSEAENVIAQAGKGQRFTDGYINSLQQRLLGIARQQALLGQESQGMELGLALGEIRRSMLVSEAKDVLAGADKGQRFTDRYVSDLQRGLLGMGRQDELLGEESVGMALALALGRLRR
jgi:hypothetical protein